MRAKAASINTEGRAEPARYTYTIGGHVVFKPAAGRRLVAAPVGRALELTDEASGDGED